MRGNVDSVPTEVKLTVPADPKVLKLEEVVVFAFELSALEAHRLPPGEPCERCMCNFMTYWHRLPTAACPGRVADPGKLRTQPHEIDAASDPYDEKDSLRITTLEPRIVRMKEALRRIATLEVRIVRMEEALRSRDKIIDEKNALLKEKHINYYNLVHLGSHCYSNRDLAETLQLTWEHSNRKRVMELEELSAWISVEYRREPHVESFALPPIRLCSQVLHPPARVATEEMTQALSTLSQLYEGDLLELPVYLDNESGPLRGPAPEYHPGNGDVNNDDFPCSD
ncbi:hypothetical protein SETIT_1G156300v2 [Setaria italica]|uniref:Uncharacterized protein n=1 Tax=Setaria italica TaxID=4555 RepID=A0A368PLI6_SETIT|nr:hypothetical protein SETIT_1G156300v2 [Setaria italica]